MKEDRTLKGMVPIKGYEGLYEINRCGVVLSLVRNPKILKYRLDRYYRVGLTKDGKQKAIMVHRLVAIAFIPNPMNKPQVNHIDGDKLNNCVENLEWCTASENVRHAVDNRLRPISKETRKKMSERMMGNIPWNKGKRLKPPTHGTMYEYNKGCRCDECKKCNTNYCRSKNKKN